MRILIGSLVVASIAFAGSVASNAQTTTTKTKTTTDTKSETKTFQSKDGTRKKTETTTKTQTDQRSISKTKHAPSGHTGTHNYQQDRDVRRSNRAQGEWTAVVGGKPCIINIYGGFEAGGGGATSQGCPGDLADIGNWQLRGGTTLVFTKMLVVPVASLRRIDAFRFNGTTSNGQQITLYR